ncbi:MAG: phosphatidate cytidylyltransferase [Myxococcota bacterium]
MIVRITAAFVGLLVLIPALMLGGLVAVHVVTLAAMAICLNEYARMAFPEHAGEAFAWLLGITVLPYLAHSFIGPGPAVTVLALALITVSTRVALRPGASLDAAFAKLGRYGFAAVWIGSLVFIPLLRQLDHGLTWIFMALGLAWLSDTGGYFAGRFFGKTPLHPQLSPKKTVEGYVGGIIGATSGTAFFAWVGLPTVQGAWWAGESMSVSMQALPTIGPLDVVAIGVGIGTLGVLGDLVESLVKRATGVKDAGSIMPGHGGLLDRVDSLLFVVPALYGYATLVEGLSA